MRTLKLLAGALLLGLFMTTAAADNADAKAEPPRKVIPAGADGKLTTVLWDVAEDRAPSKIGWPKDQGGNNVYVLEGDFQFQLKVKDGKNFDGRVRQVEARKKGALVEGVEITGHPEATDQTYAHAKSMLQDLGFGQKDIDKLDAWYAKAKKGDFDNLDLTIKNSYDRVYTVHVVNDGTSELPWSVGLDIDWSKVCGCHG